MGAGDRVRSHLRDGSTHRAGMGARSPPQCVGFAAVVNPGIPPIGNASHQRGFADLVGWRRRGRRTELIGIAPVLLHVHVEARRNLDGRAGSEVVVRQARRPRRRVCCWVEDPVCAPTWGSRESEQQAGRLLCQSGGFELPPGAQGPPLAVFSTKPCKMQVQWSPGWRSDPSATWKR